MKKSYGKWIVVAVFALAIFIALMGRVGRVFIADKKKEVEARRTIMNAESPDNPKASRTERKKRD